MKITVLKLAVGIAVFAATCAITQAQTPTPAAPPAPPAAAPPRPAPPQPTAYDKWEKAVKNPASWLTWGADLRLRNEYFNNAITLNEGTIRHEQDYFRFRERLWTSITPVTNLSVNARLAAEQREWMKPSYSSQYGTRSGFEERYAILDNANVKYNNTFGLPLSLTAGRQDIQFGDPLNWWLVADGTPVDGSWTFFLDSIRVGYEAKEIKTKFDLVYIYQNASPDEWIPTIGRSSKNYPPGSPTAKPYALTEQNEQGVILYMSNKSVKNTQVDGYFIYKRDDQEFANGDSADIYTLGAKFTGTPVTHWAYSVEGAYQFGSKQDATVEDSYIHSKTDWRDIGAFGMNAKLTYLFKDKLDNQVSFSGEYLSGDDPHSKGRDEMFDALWGRWPRWSELYIYSYLPETSGKIAQINNIIRFGPTWSCAPIKNMTFSATYNALFSPEAAPTRRLDLDPKTPGLQNNCFSNDGNFRGHYLQTVLKHKFNDHLSGHLWGEFIWQGDYYAQRDLLTFLRAEVMLTF